MPRKPIRAKKKLRYGSPAWIAAKLAKQSLATKQSKQLKQAKHALSRFKPNKKERGEIVFIGITGSRSAKGKKGYLVHVTKTGKKQLLKSAKGEPFQARRFADLEPQFSKKLVKAQRKFEKKRLKIIKGGTVVVKKRGYVNGKRVVWDFNDKRIDEMAKGIKRGIEQQASHRTFLVHAIVLIEDRQGQQHSVEVMLPIDKPDHIAIALAGIKNFVRQKFYAFMARELAFLGYVTSGSANHIRRLEANEGLDDSEWVDSRGEPWHGSGMEIVRIQRIDWTLEQAQ